MNWIKKFATFYLSILLASGPAFSQKSLFFNDSSETSFEISFKMSQNLIILPIRINGSVPMNFVLDSGITNTIITELTGVDTLSLKYLREITLAGLGSGDPGKAFASTGNDLTIDHPAYSKSGIKGNNHDIYILPEDYFTLSKQLGMKINGLIGSAFFTSFIVEINYTDQIITFHDPDRFNMNRKYRRYKEFPLELIGQKAFINATLLQDSDRLTDLKLLIDTGASLSLWVAAHSNPDIVIPDQTIPAMLGQGLSGIITGVNARIKGLEFASHKFKNLIVSFPDSSSVSGMIVEYNRNGSIGNDILRRFNIIFDYPHNRFFVETNKCINDIFSYNKSGMEIEKPYLNLPVYTVFNVVAGSPADVAGVKVGDQIEMINFLLSKNLQMDEINSMLHGHSGRSIRLHIKRNGESLKIRFKLHGDI